MNYIDFGKEIQKISNYFKEKTGKNLNIAINEETGYLSSTVYCGLDYPKEREGLLKFLKDKIDDFIN